MTKQSDQKSGRPSKHEFEAQVQAARRNRELIAMLARWRSGLGLSQAECARRMRTSQPAVARLESHQHDVQLSTLARYVTALGLTLHFVLTDSDSGSPVWTSLVSRSQDAPEKVRVVEDTWTKLSGHDLEPDQYVITQSKEPGWSLFYQPSGQATPQDVAQLHSGRTATAEDPHVVGFFGPEDPDPVAIATAIEMDGEQVRQMYKLAAKFKETFSGVTAHYMDIDDDEFRQYRQPMCDRGKPLNRDVTRGRRESPATNLIRILQSYTDTGKP